MTQKFKVKKYTDSKQLQEGINEMYEMGYKPILMTEIVINTLKKFTIVFEFGVYHDKLIKEKKEAISLEN